MDKSSFAQFVEDLTAPIDGAGHTLNEFLGLLKESLVAKGYCFGEPQEETTLQQMAPAVSVMEIPVPTMETIVAAPVPDPTPAAPEPAPEEAPTTQEPPEAKEETEEPAPEHVLETDPTPAAPEPAPAV